MTVTGNQLMTLIQQNCPPGCDFPVVTVDAATGKSAQVTDARVFNHPKRGLVIELSAPGAEQ